MSAKEAACGGGSTGPRPAASVSRRGFVAAGVVGAALVTLGGVGMATGSAEAAFVRPPGASGNASLVSACNRCDKCVQACPYGIVSPVPLAQGLATYGTPELVFRNGSCDFCMKCTEACPTGALAFGGARERDCGVAVVVRDACVAWDWSGCTVCHDRCPVEGAITLDERNRPVVHPEYCDGCGLCEQVCPSASLRSYNATVYERGIVVVSRESVLASEQNIDSARVAHRYERSAQTTAPHSEGVHPDGPGKTHTAGGN